MLAQTGVPPEVLGYWILALITVLFGAHVVTAIIANIKKIRGEPPAPPTPDTVYVTHAQFDAFKSDNARQMSEIRNEINADMKAMLQSIARITGILEAREFTRAPTHD